MIKIHSAAQHRAIGTFISKRLIDAKDSKWLMLYIRAQSKNDARLQIASLRERPVARAVAKSQFFAAAAPLCEELA